MTTGAGLLTAPDMWDVEGWDSVLPSFESDPCFSSTCGSRWIMLNRTESHSWCWHWRLLQLCNRVDIFAMEENLQVHSSFYVWEDECLPTKQDLTQVHSRAVPWNKGLPCLLCDQSICSNPDLALVSLIITICWHVLLGNLSLLDSCSSSNFLAEKGICLTSNCCIFRYFLR